MSEEWKEVRLSDVAEILMGQSPPGDSYNTVGEGLPFLQGSAEFGTQTPVPQKWCSKPLKMATEGDLLMSVRAPVGDTNFADQQIAIGRGLAILRGRDAALTHFLRLVIQSKTSELVAASGSGMFASITGANLRNFRFVLPPIPVQRRIVDLMTHLDAHIANLQAEREASLALVSSLRSDLFNQISNDVIPAGEMFDLLLGRQKSARQSVGEHVLPYIRAGNITEYGLKLGDVQTMNFDPSEQIKYGLVEGDILLVEGGTIGLAARWSGQINGFVGFDKHVIRIRGRHGKSVSEFALQWANWCRQSGAFDAQSTGITIRALGFGRASAMPVPSLSVQQQVNYCAPLAAVDSVVTDIQSEILRLRALRSSFLDALLSATIEMPNQYETFLTEVA